MNPVISKDDYMALLRKYNNMFYKPKTITIDPTKEYTEEEMVEMIKKLPDGIRFPLPNSWYEKYDIPRPEPMTFTEALHNSFKVIASDAPTEIRPPAEGGIRIIPLQIDEATQTDSQPKLQEEVESHS
jgi:hypothetical protein